MCLRRRVVCACPPPQAKNSEMLVECFYALEDFASLGTLMDALPEGTPLLLNVGDKFQSVGLCNEGVAAFIKVTIGNFTLGTPVTHNSVCWSRVSELIQMKRGRAWMGSLLCRFPCFEL